MMRYIVIFLILFPSFILAQNVGIGTNNPTEKLEVNGIIFTRGGIKFPDGTIQTTAAPSSARSGPTSSESMSTSSLPAGVAIVVDFHPVADIIGPAVGPGFNHGLNISSFQSPLETIATFDGINYSFSPNLANATFTTHSRATDAISTNLRMLVTESVIIPYISIFFLNYTLSGSVVLYKIMVFENCVLTRHSTYTNNVVSTEVISFDYAKVCNREFDDQGNIILSGESCIDEQNPFLECSCFFPYP